MKWVNPYEKRRDFINLGDYTHTDCTVTPHKTTYYQFYALDSLSRDTIDLGAKYGPEDSHYQSGTLYFCEQERQWKLLGSDLMARVAFLLFANYLKDGY